MKARPQLADSALSTPRLPGSFQSGQHYASSESSVRQPAHTQPSLTFSQNKAVFPESNSSPQQFVRGGLPSAHHHLRPESPLSFDGSSDDRMPWGSHLPYGILEGYSQPGDRHQYSSNDAHNNVAAGPDHGEVLSGQSLLPGLAPALSTSQGQNGQSLGSTLAQAFAPSTSAGNQVPQSYRHSSAAGASAALTNRPRASTLSVAPLGGRKPLLGQQEQTAPFQRSLSSDGMNTSPLDMGRFATGGMEHLPSGPMATGSQGSFMSPQSQQHVSPYVGGSSQSSPFAHQSAVFPRSSGPSNDSWDQQQDYAAARGHYREHSGGGGYKDHDPSRLSLALAKTQIGGPSARVEPSQLQQPPGQQYGISSTIIERS